MKTVTIVNEIGTGLVSIKLYFCNLRGRGAERMVDVVPGGTEFDPFGAGIIIFLF